MITVFILCGLAIYGGVKAVVWLIEQLWLTSSPD